MSYESLNADSPIRAHATHIVSLHLFNDYGAYSFWMERAELYLNNAEKYYARKDKADIYEMVGNESAARNLLADEMEETAEGIKNDAQDCVTDRNENRMPGMMFSDLIGRIFACVNWDEIATQFIDAVQEG